MEKKFKMEANKDGGNIDVTLDGLEEIFYTMMDMQSAIDEYGKFAENVLLSCVMPEVPRYILEVEDGSDDIGNAWDALQRLLVRYRKLVSWMRTNGIDVEAVCGDKNDRPKN